MVVSAVDAYLAVVVAIAFLVEAAAGFGSTVITLALAAFVVDRIDDVLTVLLPVNVALSALIVWKDWRFVDRHLLGRRILPLVTAGLLVGIGIARVSTPLGLRAVFAVFVTGLGLRELLGWGARSALPPRWVQGALLAGGVVHGIFACGGPLVVFGTTQTAGDKRTLRATLSALWLILNTVYWAPQRLAHGVTPAEFQKMLFFVPSLLVGGWVGQRLHTRLDEARFRRVVWSLLTLVGVVLLATTLSMWRSAVR